MTNRNPVPFRWAALSLSALVTPGPFGLAAATGSIHPVYAFAVCAVLGYGLALAIVGGLLLPALWILSWIAPIKGWLTTLVGGLVAFLVFVGWDRINWGASGVDSGPPDCTYAQWIARNWTTGELFGTVGVGLVSAAVYHYAPPVASCRPRLALEPELRDLALPRPPKWSQPALVQTAAYPA